MEYAAAIRPASRSSNWCWRWKRLRTFVIGIVIIASWVPHRLLNFSAIEPMNQQSSIAGDITNLLHRAARGDSEAEAEAMRLTYVELRRLAAGFRRRERRDLTLQASDIVHEVCAGLIGAGRNFNDSEH